MSLFSWFHRKGKNAELTEQRNFSSETAEEDLLSGEMKIPPTEVDEQAKEEARRQIEEAKVEYEAVTSYLTDIQRIDRAAEEERRTFTEAAEKILFLKGEREKYKSQEIKLSERHRNSMEMYEASLPKELKAMQEKEQYQSVIKSDLRHLEGEKGVLLYERDEIVKKQEALKKLAVTAAVLVTGLLLLLLLLAQVFEVSMLFPFLLDIFMGVASAAYIVYESRRNRTNMVLTEKKLSRAIGLLNKVKVKYVNNTSCLEYAYEKLGVESAMELEYIWKQYLLLKEREKQFRSATEKINQYNRILITELKKLGVNDAEVWTYQPEALLDNKEMVEVRHRLNVRRQKLRERMEYNNALLEQETQRRNT